MTSKRIFRAALIVLCATRIVGAWADEPRTVSWDELHRHAKALAWRLVELGPCSLVGDSRTQPSI